MTDPLIDAARFLQSQLEWMRHAVDGTEPYAVSAFAEIDWCAGRLRGLVNGPSEKRYLGPCGAHVGCCDLHNRHCEPPSELCCSGCSEVAHPEHPPGVDCAWLQSGESPVCNGNMYVRGDASTGRCGTCGATVSRADREAWLDGEVRAHAFTAREIADAHPINVKTIRSWAGRGQLKSYRRTDAGLVIPWTDDSTTERLHYVGDVLDLAAADAARRETARATRERRKETAA